MKGRAVRKTLMGRWKQHLYRAKCESKDWKLCRAIRKFTNWTQEVVEFVRGKTNAHLRERELIRKLKPKLNTW